jgi:nucleotide-binding universal stress UspA family protein
VIDRVVVPVDFSAQSDRGVMIGAALASWLDVTIELVTVAAPAAPRDVRGELETIARTVDRATCTVVESSRPTADALLSEVRRHRVSDLWCVGTHARGGVGESLLGSVSERLVREADIPIVLVGPHVHHVPGGNVIGVALDGSAHSELVLPAVEEMRMATGMSLRLLQVVPRPPSPAREDVMESGYLSRLAARAAPGPHDAVVDYDVLHGVHPADDISTYVEGHPEIGMLALATRGLTGRDRLRHGSVAFEVAHRSSVPVLVLHTTP